MKHTETQLIRVRSLGQLSLLLALSAGTCAAQVWAPQSTFGTQGVHDYDSHVGDDVAYDHVMMPDGRLLLAGGGWWTGCNCNHITLGVIDTLCGKPDATFGADGRSACPGARVASWNRPFEPAWLHLQANRASWPYRSCGDEAWAAIPSIGLAIPSVAHRYLE